jgi:hypothetical protein
MITRTLARRLERLEEQMTPEGDPKVWVIIVVASDSTRTPTGERIEMSSYTRGRQSKMLKPWRRLR